MELGNDVNKEEVQKCWILHEYKTRKKDIGSVAITAIGRADWQIALYSYRGKYPEDVFTNLKQWKQAKLDQKDIENLKHVSCELDNLSNGSRRISDVVQNLLHNEKLADPKANPSSHMHVTDIFNRLNELATDETPVIVGRDYVRDNSTIIFDGFNRLVATLIYYKRKKNKQFKSKDAYYGS